MTEAGFSDLAAAMTRKGDDYHAHIPAHWRQGRTAYGGLTAGLAYEAAARHFDDLPPLRSVMVNFIGPVGEDTHFTPSVLRRGKNVVSINVDAMCGGAIGARVTLVFGASRESHISVDGPPADKTKQPEDYDAFTPPHNAKFVPPFFHQFETRLIEGGRPMEGAKDGFIDVWSRHTHVGARDTIGGLVTIGDVLPPAAMPLFKKVGPVSSVTWMLNLLTDAPKTQNGWYRLDTRLTAASNGYSSQKMHIWNTDGDLIAEGMQSIAIFV